MTERELVNASNCVFLPSDHYRALPRTPEAWVIEPLIPAGGLCNLYGPPKIGKSYAAVQLALAVAQGKPDWLGFAVKTPGPVAYLQLDTPRSLWAARLDALHEHGITTSELLIADSEQAPYPFDILDEKGGFAWLAQQLDAIRPVMLIVDTLREAHRGDENDSAQMQKVMSALVAASRPAALVLVSHSRKDNPQYGEDLLNDNRGSSYVAGRMDSILRIGRNQLAYKGRAIDEHRLQLKRLPNGFWTHDATEVDLHLKKVLSDPTLTSIRDRAKKLSDLSGKDLEACRSLLRRHEATRQTQRIAAGSSAEPVTVDVATGEIIDAPPAATTPTAG